MHFYWGVVCLMREKKSVENLNRPIIHSSRLVIWFDDVSRFTTLPPNFLVFTKESRFRFRHIIFFKQLWRLNFIFSFGENIITPSLKLQYFFYILSIHAIILDYCYIFHNHVQVITLLDLWIFYGLWGTVGWWIC